MSKTDILEYIPPHQAWAMENHLETTTGSPIYTFYDAGTGELWNMKGSGGFPWDSWHVGEDYLYQRVTENDKAPWTAVGYASSFKLFCSKTWPNGKGGIAWCQRYFQEGGFNAPIMTADSSYQYFAACAPVKPVLNLSRPTMNKLEGPYSIDFGGTLGVQKAIVMPYWWGNGFSTMEVNYCAWGFGRCQWEKYGLVNGVYILQQTSAFNMVIAGVPPKLSFPCGQVL